jgi:hypothetical protein
LSVVKFKPVQVEVRQCGNSGPSQYCASLVINSADVMVFVKEFKNVTLDNKVQKTLRAYHKAGI